MNIHQKLYIKEMKLELESVQSIYVQKITNFGYFRWLTIEEVDFLFRMFQFSHVLK